MNRIALITGASRGIGAAAAREFARNGYAVVLAARDEAALRSVATDIQAQGGQALAVATDVADQVSVERLVRAAVEEFGGLDAAFNTAGAAAHRRLLAGRNSAGRLSKLRCA